MVCWIATVYERPPPDPTDASFVPSARAGPGRRSSSGACRTSYRSRRSRGVPQRRGLEAPLRSACRCGGRIGAGQGSLGTLFPSPVVMTGWHPSRFHRRNIPCHPCGGQARRPGHPRPRLLPSRGLPGARRRSLDPGARFSLPPFPSGRKQPGPVGEGIPGHASRRGAGVAPGHGCRGAGRQREGLPVPRQDHRGAVGRGGAEHHLLASSWCCVLLPPP